MTDPSEMYRPKRSTIEILKNQEGSRVQVITDCVQKHRYEPMDLVIETNGKKLYSEVVSCHPDYPG